MLTSLVGLVLSCQLSQMLPDYYTAEIKFNSQTSADLKLTYLFYGASFDYKYSLKKTALGMEGKTKTGDSVIIHSIEAKSKSNYNLVIDSKKNGYLEMNCKIKS